MKEYSSTFSSGFTATAPPLSPVWSTTVLHCRCSAFDLSGGASPSTLLHQYHAATHLVACGMTASNASSCIHHDSTPEVLLCPGRAHSSKLLQLQCRNQTMDLTTEKQTSQTLNQLNSLLRIHGYHQLNCW